MNRHYRIKAFGIVLVFLNALAAQNLAVAESKQEFVYGDWKGKSHFSSKSGQFSRCSVEALYKSNIGLSFALSDVGGMEIWLFNQDWELDAGTSYPIRYAVDRLKTFSAKATALASHGVRIDVSKTRTFFNMVRKGRTLRVFGASEPLEFNLVGTSGALNKLRECWLRWTTYAPKSKSKNPFASKRSSTNPFTKSTQNRTDVSAKFARQMLSGLADHGFRIQNEVPPEFEYLKASLFWSAPNAFGFSNKVPADFDLNTIKKVIGAADKKSCAGEFAVAGRIENFGRGIPSKIVQTACTENQKGVPFYVFYAFYPLKSGGSVRISHLGFTSEASLKAHNRFFDQIDRFMKRSGK